MRPEASMVHGPTAGSPVSSQDPVAAPKDLPSVDRLLRDPAVTHLMARHGHAFVAAEARRLLEASRGRALGGTLTMAELHHLPAELDRLCGQRLAPRMRRVINLTGTVLHTNLGRALLADEALRHVLTCMSSPNNLEFDLARGERGDRDSLVESLLCDITGAEAATVVNNNAAAVLLGIAALAGGKRPWCRAASWSRSAAPSACPT